MQTTHQQALETKHAALRLGSGRWRGVHPATWAIAGLFVLRYALE